MRADEGFGRDAQDITRRYDTVLDYGSGPGYLAKHMDQEITKKVVMVDSSRAFASPALP